MKKRDESKVLNQIDESNEMKWSKWIEEDEPKWMKVDETKELIEANGLKGMKVNESIGWIEVDKMYLGILKDM